MDTCLPCSIPPCLLSMPRAVAETMVQMECDYVTPSFFRELEKQYQLEQQAQGAEGEGGNDRLNQLATGGQCGK